MKINIKEIMDAIKANRNAPEKKWWIETIEFVDSVDTAYGQMDKYEVIARISVRSNDYRDNGFKYQINHYVDEESYGCYYNGSCFLP